MTDRELQIAGSAARARDASASPAGEEGARQGNGNRPRIVRSPSGVRSAPDLDLHMPDPDPVGATADGGGPPAGPLARDLDPEDRVGPYLLFDDDADGSAAMPADADVQPERVRRRPRRTARSLLAALRAGATGNAERLEGAALWWVALRPATFALSGISVAIGALVAAGAGKLVAAGAGVAVAPLAQVGMGVAPLAQVGMGVAPLAQVGMGVAPLAQVAIAVAVLAGVLAAHGGRNLLEQWSALGRGGGEEPRAAGSARASSRDAARAAATHLGRRRLLAGAGLAYAAGAAVLLVLVRVSGAGVAWFGGVGLALSLADVLPPLALQHRAAGAVAGAIAWGPLIVGGSAFAVRGEVPAAAWLASVAFALAVAAALLGERLEAREVRAEREAGDAGFGEDRERDGGLGDDRGRDLVVKLAQLALVWIGALVVAGVVSPWALLALLGLPRFRRLVVAYAPARERGSQDAVGDGHAAVAMRFARTTGALLALGLAVGLIAAAPH